MTEKKAAFGNNFTPEQRAAALKRAAELRAARAEYLARVKSGEVGIAAALAEGKENPVVGRIKAKRLFRSSGSRYRAPRVLGTLPVRETCACAGTARVRRG